MELTFGPEAAGAAMNLTMIPALSTHTAIVSGAVAVGVDLAPSSLETVPIMTPVSDLVTPLPLDGAMMSS